MVLVEVLEHVFPVSWEQIAMASWLKYPHASRPDILSLDLLDRHYDHESGTLTSYRLSLIRGMMPSWVCSLTGGCVCMFLETSVINPRKGFVQLSSKNITCNSVLQLEEVCTYTRAKDAPASSTHFRQELKISAFVWGVAGQIESIGRDNFLKNATKGRDIMMEAVAKIPLATRGVIFDPRALIKDESASTNKT
jgi:hypothetical protein